MDFIISIGLFLPLLGFLALLFTAHCISRKSASLIACSTVLVSFFSFVSILIMSDGTMEILPRTLSFFRWIPIEGINADFSLLIDSLSLLMALIITGIGFLIHVYSIGYMDHEEDFARYFACLNFFIFAMLLLVLSAELLLVFVGWEAVGLASYLLIGFWYDRAQAAKAATKAFVVNRIGDLGFLLGLLLTFTLFGTSNITAISHQAVDTFSVNSPLVILFTLLYFCGAIGKSAQLPLHVWLPDAMEGPTPVSALIHAATMVTAGVYLVVRMHTIFLLAPFTLHVIGIIGGVTALFAACSALAQTDLKRVLAYSTISQLGFMFLACGASSFYAAMFHLTTHAFMKGLLFLAAGNVVHMMHGTTDMAKMGGLSKIFTKTHIFFLVGVLAMSGVPMMSAFFSKDLILEQEHLAGFNILFWIGLLASLLTAFYLTRAYVLTFMGKNLLPEEKLKNIHEAPSIMLIPVGILAFLAIFGGILGFSLHGMPILEDFLAKSDVTLAEKTSHTLFTYETTLSVIAAFFGIGTALLIYTRYKNRIDGPIKFLQRGFFINELYEKCIVHPLQLISAFIAQFIEPKIFESSIQKTVSTTQGTAFIMQKMQSGQIRSYIAWMALGAVFLLSYLIF